MKWKVIISDYFTFSRRERIGLLTVLVLVITLFFSPSIFRTRDGSGSKLTDTAWITALKKLEQKENNADGPSAIDNETSYYQPDPSRTNYNNKPAGELFYFDPNSISREGWQKLGLRDKTIQTIQKYLAKGGHFNKPEDLQKVYGLRKNEYDRLSPYISIQRESNEKTGSFTFKNESTGNYSPARPSSRFNLVDINTADTSAFIALPGIGSKLAVRIINFRDKLGGFYSAEQVKEVFGLADSVFQKIKDYLVIKNTSIRKININTATPDEMKSHPYIKRDIANAIEAFRKEHGPFSGIEDLKKVMIITADGLKKMTPYLDTR